MTENLAHDVRTWMRERGYPVQSDTPDYSGYTVTAFTDRVLITFRLAGKKAERPLADRQRIQVEQLMDLESNLPAEYSTDYRAPNRMGDRPSLLVGRKEPVLTLHEHVAKIQAPTILAAQVSQRIHELGHVLTIANGQLAGFRVAKQDGEVHVFFEGGSDGRAQGRSARLREAGHRLEILREALAGSFAGTLRVRSDREPRLVINRRLELPTKVFTVTEEVAQAMISVKFGFRMDLPEELREALNILEAAGVFNLPAQEQVDGS